MGYALATCVTVAVFLLMAQPAQAAKCAVYLGDDFFANSLEINTVDVDDLAKPNPPQPGRVEKSADEYNSNLSYANKLCDNKKKPYIYALLTAWRAWLEHADAQGNPQHTAELAAQKLEQCTVAFYGTNAGATCAQWEKQVIRWQQAWENP